MDTDTDRAANDWHTIAVNAAREATIAASAQARATAEQLHSIARHAGEMELNLLRIRVNPCPSVVETPLP